MDAPDKQSCLLAWGLSRGAAGAHLEPRARGSSALRLRQEVMRAFREEDVGGRLVYSLTGSSPIAPEVLVFLRGALQAPTYEGYGSTEAGYVRTVPRCIARLWS